MLKCLCLTKCNQHIEAKYGLLKQTKVKAKQFGLYSTENFVKTNHFTEIHERNRKNRQTENLEKCDLTEILQT